MPTFMRLPRALRREKCEGYEITLEVGQRTLILPSPEDRVGEALPCAVELMTPSLPSRILLREVKELESARYRTPKGAGIFTLPLRGSPHFTPDMAELFGKRESEPTLLRDSHVNQ